MTVKPFAGIRPDPRYASIVHVAPYDVVTTTDVRRAVKNNPYSFFHVTRAEADIPDIQDEHSQMVYDKAAENLQHLTKLQKLELEGNPISEIDKGTARFLKKKGLVQGPLVPLMK